MAYTTRYHWEGTLNHEDYPRNALVDADQAPTIPVGVGASTPGGSEARWNPETLLGAAVSDCYMLTFLSLAKKVRADLRILDTTATSHVVTDGMKRSRVEKIELVTRAVVGPDTDVEKVRSMYEKAHKYCIIANSLSAEVVATIDVVVG
jgi:organic hydroperoxide reductase OsmC/OhrA